MRTVVGFCLALAWIATTPVRAAEPWTWNGPYAGIFAGFGKSGGNVRYTDFPSGSFASTFASGIVPLQQPLHAENTLGGFLAGYNVQAGPAVFGIEVDVSAGGLRGSNTYSYQCACNSVDTIATQSLDWLATVRGRIGVVPVANWMLFATAGLAIGRVETKFNVATVPAFASIDAEGSGVRTGVVYGGGGEFALSKNITARFEYLHYDLGSSSISAPYNVVGFVLPLGLIGQYRVSGEIVRAALTYHFD